jgi:hypothetical protein
MHDRQGKASVARLRLVSPPDGPADRQTHPAYRRADNKPVAATADDQPGDR